MTELLIDSKELKNCPFCNSEADLDARLIDGDEEFYIGCSNHKCIANFIWSGYFSNDWFDAQKAWNRRATDKNYRKLKCFVMALAYKGNEVDSSILQDRAAELLKEVGE